MTTAASVPTASVSDKTAIYFVVPVIPENGSVESVYYYGSTPDNEPWVKVPPNKLDAKGQGCHANQVKLQQPSAATIVARTGLSIDQLDQTVSLYAGVARTLSATPDSLPSHYAPASDGTMTVPVQLGTTRGLILVFTRTTPGQPPGQITDLIATTDPEIPNGVGDPDPDTSSDSDSEAVR